MKENDVSKPEWEIIWTAITESPGIVVVLGASDTGKTTWVRATARWLVQHGRLPIALVDTDIGQASLGPPATVAMRLLTAADGEAAGWFAHDTFSYDALSFIGSVSPMGHTLQLLVSSHRLVEQAKQKGTAVVLVDTTGLITPGFGFQLKLRKIELLNPIHVVALQRSDELESLLMVIDRQGRRVHRLRVSDSVKPRTAADRAIYRARRLAAYFAHAHVLTCEPIICYSWLPRFADSACRRRAHPTC